MTSLTKDGIQKIEPLTAAEVDPFDPEQAVRAQMPLMDTWAKTDYLSYRACGFSIREAGLLAGVGQKTIQAWRRTDKDFLSWEGERLGELQHRIGDTVLRAQFMRCMHLTMKIDGDALKQLAFGSKNMTDTKSISEDVKEWAKDAAKRYKSQDLAMMLKVLEPEGGTSGLGGLSLNVTVNNEVVVDQIAQQAAVKKLMEQFTVNTKVIEVSDYTVE